MWLTNCHFCGVTRERESLKCDSQCEEEAGWCGQVIPSFPHFHLLAVCPHLWPCPSSGAPEAQLWTGSLHRTTRTRWSSVGPVSWTCSWRSQMGARANKRRWGERGVRSLGGGEPLACLSCMWKHSQVLRYDIIAQAMRLPANDNSSVRLPKGLLLRSIVDTGINWHVANQCVICLIDCEMLLQNWPVFQDFVLIILTPMEIQAAKWLILPLSHPQIGTCTLNPPYWTTVKSKKKYIALQFFTLQTKPVKSLFQPAEAAFALQANLCRKRWELVRKSPLCSCVLLRLEEGSVTFLHKAFSISVYLGIRKESLYLGLLKLQSCYIIGDHPGQIMGWQGPGGGRKGEEKGLVWKMKLAAKDGLNLVSRLETWAEMLIPSGQIWILFLGV